MHLKGIAEEIGESAMLNQLRVLTVLLMHCSFTVLQPSKSKYRKASQTPIFPGHIKDAKSENSSK